MSLIKILTNQVVMKRAFYYTCLFLYPIPTAIYTIANEIYK